jgi:flagellar hook-length control protein FliK
MNPFGGVMQALSGSASGLGDLSADIGKNVQGGQTVDGGKFPADESTRSFLAWVRNFMDSVSEAGPGDESILSLQPGEREPDQRGLNQLQALIADAMDQVDAGLAVAQPLTGERLDEGHIPLPQGIIDALIAHHSHSHAADVPDHEAPPPEAPEMTVKQTEIPTAGQASTAIDDPHLKAVASGVPTQQVETFDACQSEENTPVTGQAYASAKEAFPKATVAGVPTPAGQADAPKDKEIPIDGLMKGNNLQESFEKSAARSLFQPETPAGDDRRTRTNPLMREQLSSALDVTEKSVESASPRLQPTAVQTRDPSFMATVAVVQSSNSTDDDAANFQRKGTPSPTGSGVLADVNDDEWSTEWSSNSVKSTVHEPVKPNPALQDPAKSMEGVQSTNMAVKTATGQVAELTRTEDPAAKTFQTTVMDQIVDKAVMRSINGRSEVQIRLKPEFLGNVHMNIATDKEQLVVRIMTDRPMVKEIIETHLHHLKTELQNQGLTIDRFDVMVNPDADQQNGRDQFAQMFKQQPSQNGRRQPQEQDQETMNRDGANHFEDDRANRDGVNYFA